MSTTRRDRTEAAVRAQRTKEARLRRRDLALAIASPVLLLVLWEVCARALIIDPRFFPAPTRILQTGIEMAASGELWSHAGPTLARLLVGGGLGAVAGVVVGLLMGSSRALNAALGPLFAALYPLPKIAIFPILLMIFGPTEVPKLLAVFITTFFILQINTVSGVWAIDPKLHEAGRAYGARGFNRFRHVILPGALPFVFSGLRTATGTAVVVITAVEFTGASTTGLGYLIWNSWQLFIPEKLYVGLVVIGVIGAALTFVITRSETLLLPWRRR
ncbi:MULTISPECIES: ABC transporter permease [Helcobacillus]|uniref:NitT/TauT family transport system permease protein n=1 Tax=Helcobacillus massiliensis TaxID=521392 RepID=A0A839QTF2_9MICO|nr:MULTISPECIES: ABC transporter permease [Helcobacillus]MBB3023763.1 NitT/TauT family transport system permease protein [Helcobacillus massiliensis]MCG7426127.1 ABC transporter permease [Helcobacillus sp. ACRRO]